MKEVYEEVQMEIIEFACGDIITDSTPIAPLSIFDESGNSIR